MKRVRCPKCDHYITFDETRYPEGQSLVFECDECHKQFAIRIGMSKLKATRKEETFDENEHADAYGSIVVVENVFHYKQVLPLRLGDNVIGRRNKGTDVDIAIESSDADLERRHCIINVRRNKNGELVYTLRDCSARSGTYLRQDRLGKRDQVRLDSADVVSIGGTTFILHVPGGDEEE